MTDLMFPFLETNNLPWPFQDFLNGVIFVGWIFRLNYGGRACGCLVSLSGDLPVGHIPQGWGSRSFCFVLSAAFSIIIRGLLIRYAGLT